MRKLFLILVIIVLLFGLPQFIYYQYLTNPSYNLEIKLSNSSIETECILNAVKQTYEKSIDLGIDHKSTYSLARYYKFNQLDTYYLNFVLQESDSYKVLLKIDLANSRERSSKSKWINISYSYEKSKAVTQALSETWSNVFKTDQSLIQNIEESCHIKIDYAKIEKYCSPPAKADGMCFLGKNL